MAEFNLQVGIDASGARRGARQVNQALGSIRGKQVNRRLGETRQRILGIGGAARSIRPLIGALFAGVAVRGVIKYADAYTKLNNQIKLVTSSAKETAIIQNELFKLASETRAPVEELSTLYGRAAFSAKELGASQGELLQFTRGVAQALAINGTSAIEARGALIQLSQALGSTIVRAEEFNAINEGAKPILIAVADGLGLTVAQLRAAVVAGKVTNKQFFEAFQKNLGNLDRLFAKTAPTIGQAFTGLQNSLTLVAGRLNESTGFATGFGRAIAGLSNFIKGPGLNALVTLSTELGFLMDDFANLKKFVADSLSDINPQESPTLGLVRRGLTEFFTAPISSIKSFIQITVVQVVNFFKKLFVEAKLRVNRIKAFFAGILPDDAARLIGIDPDFNFAAAENNFKAELMRLDNARDTTITTILANLEEDKQKIADAVGQVNQEFSQAEIDAVLSRAPTIGTGQGETPPELAEFANPVDDALQDLKDSIADFEGANVPFIRLQQDLAAIDELQKKAAESGLAVSQEAIAAAVAAAHKEYADALDELSGYNDALDRAKDITESVLTPTERMKNELAELQDLLDRGLISDEVFRRARIQIEQAANQTNLMRDVAKAAAEDIQGAFRDLFLEGTDSLSDFADQFGQTLQRIAANFLANQAIRFLLGDTALETGQFGGVLGQIGNLFTGRGGPAADTTPQTETIGEALASGAGVLTKAVGDGAPALTQGVEQGGRGLAGILGGLFQGIGNVGGAAIGGIGSLFGAFAGVFDNGGDIGRGEFGVVGERGPELVGGPASVVGRSATASMMAPEIQVAVNNFTDPKEALETVNSNQGDKTVMNSIRRNQAAIKRELGIA